MKSVSNAVDLDKERFYETKPTVVSKGVEAVTQYCDTQTYKYISLCPS